MPTLDRLPCRLYAVSSGNGNDGVSHMHPDYYVYTDDPFRLAKLALVSSFKGAYKARALDELDCDGEADYTISATLLEPLDDEPESEESDGEDAGESEDAGSYSDANGAYLIIEVFADDDGPNMADPWHTPLYYSLAKCFGDDLALVPEED